MVAACDLRWAQGLVAAVAILTRPTLALPSHPPLPSACRDARCSPVAMASIYILLPSLLVLFPLAGGWWS
jgi:hypothetical protein